MLTIWGRPSAFNVQKALWLLAELGITCDHVLAGGDHGGLDSPEFAAMNPHRRVPVIDDHGVVVWESHAIVRYLAATYGTGTWWPGEPGQRARADGWMDWSQTALQPDLMDLFWGTVRTPAAQRDHALVARATSHCARHYQLLDHWLQTRDWISGPQITMADIPVGTTLYRYFEMDIERPALPHVEAWYRRLAERPGYRAHVMRPFDELRGKLAY